MDEWEWITQVQQQLLDNGHQRLAFLIAQMSHLTVNNQHAQVDAVVPEALALTRQLKLPWVEIFIRYWHQESRVWKRFEGRSVLADVIDLTEFAHRPENLECP